MYKDDDEMTEPVQHYRLRWNNHHSNVFTMFEHLYDTGLLTDVRLVCDGVSIKCHKIVLASCSPYFKDLFVEESNYDSCCHLPVIILKDIKLSEIKAILDYMYRGEVNVAEDELVGLLSAAETLKVRGLAEDSIKVKEAPRSPIPTLVPIVPFVGAGGGPDLMKSNSSSVSMATDANTNPAAASAVSAPPKKRKRNRKVVDSGILPIQWHHNSSPSTSNTAFNGPATIQSSEGETTLPQQLESVNGDGGDKVDDDKDEVSPRRPSSAEWKRYKQYSETDLESALGAVNQGMSALKAARMFNVPSRTLYDRVRKIGIPTPTSTSNHNHNHRYRQGIFSLASLPSQPQPNANEGLEQEQLFQFQLQELFGTGNGTGETRDCKEIPSTSGTGTGVLCNGSEGAAILQGNAHCSGPLNLSFGNVPKNLFEFINL